MTVARSTLLFVLAALTEIGRAWLVRQGWREHRGLLWIAAGVGTADHQPRIGRRSATAERIATGSTGTPEETS